MTEIMASIKPEWCALIASGEKTIEVRKSYPKQVPFKAYIYCTSPSCKVIGEFLCDRVRREAEVADGLVDVGFAKASCVNYKELIKYSSGKPLYSWHISHLKIYDHPLTVDNFHVTDNASAQSCRFRWKKMILEKHDDGLMYGKIGFWCGKNSAECSKCWTRPLRRPPQSWCYVRSKSNE